MLTYISLFSSAGVGCHGLRKIGYDCAATVELIERRINVQKLNNKCSSNEGYICGDITNQTVQEKLYRRIDNYCKTKKIKGLDLVIATPPCQGISVANHKKNSKEIVRNSLVIESLKIISTIQPKFFIIENVRGFLKAACLDADGTPKSVEEALTANLFKQYRFSSKVMNFKEYGSKSSRTRTLVLGVRRDIKDCSPDSLFPDYTKSETLRDVIGSLPRLKSMGDFNKSDYLHSFRPYKKNMLPWIEATPYGASAFDNEDDYLKPHQIKDGVLVVNKSKNGDKYKRQRWEDVAPCIHTRSDCLPSQNTIHPEDNRVFSIRELMLMMTIPSDFKWIADEDIPKDKGSFLKFHKTNDVNIRQCIGEAVPTEIFTRIGKKIRAFLSVKKQTPIQIDRLIQEHRLDEPNNLHQFIIENPANLEFSSLLQICEISNANRQENAAYYTRQDTCFDVLKELPDFSKKQVRVLEPSVGIGNFLYAIGAKYHDKDVLVDCVDIDEASLATCKVLAERYLPNNVHLNFINDDFLTTDRLSHDKYDLVIGNPPYKEPNKEKLSGYLARHENNDTKNLFSFFIERSFLVSNHVALIIPKSFLDSPQYKKTRRIVESHNISSILDFGESAFNVKIETIGLVASTKPKNSLNTVKVYSHRLSMVLFQKQDYITNTEFDSWLIYRSKEFDSIAKNMEFGCFTCFRDRQISKSMFSPSGKYRVIKSRNIGNNEIIDTLNDKYIDGITPLSVMRFLNQDVLLVPNLTYNPRAAWLPKGCLPDGSAAVLIPTRKVTKEHIEYLGSDEFQEFYRIARNHSTRSMNIDSSSVKYFGLKIINNANHQHNEPLALFESVQ